MKLSKLLYLLILPMIMTPSLNASKDSNTKMNIESVFVHEFSQEDLQEDVYANRRCERNLRESEAANRYLEKEIFIMEDELARANRKIRRMQQRIQDYEFELNRYKKRSPRRPNAHGYNTSRNKGNRKATPAPRTPSRSRKNY